MFLIKHLIVVVLLESSLVSTAVMSINEEDETEFVIHSGDCDYNVLHVLGTGMFGTVSFIIIITSLLFIFNRQSQFVIILIYRI